MLIRHCIRCLRAAAFIWGFSLLAYLYGQSRPEGSHTIRVGVEEVRLDAVVVDSKGRPLTDLVAGDFEVYQDGKLQNLVSCQYIRYSQSPPEQHDSNAEKNRILPPVPSAMLKKEDIRRTIVFLVNDLFMGFDEVGNLRMALRKFVETQMQPGDAVAIMRTSTGNAALQTLSSNGRRCGCGPDDCGVYSRRACCRGSQESKNNFLRPEAV